MIFNGHLYLIRSMDEREGGFSATVHLNASHDVFKGHFPGNPVTPGVVQLEMIRELLSLYLKKEVSLSTMSSCKFLAILNPENVNDIEVIVQSTLSESGMWKVTASVQDQATIYLKVAAEYRAR